MLTIMSNAITEIMDSSDGREFVDIDINKYLMPPTTETMMKVALADTIAPPIKE